MWINKAAIRVEKNEINLFPRPLSIPPIMITSQPFTKCFIEANKVPLIPTKHPFCDRLYCFHSHHFGVSYLICFFLRNSEATKKLPRVIMQK